MKSRRGPAAVTGDDPRTRATGVDKKCRRRRPTPAWAGVATEKVDFLSTPGRRGGRTTREPEDLPVERGRSAAASKITSVARPRCWCAIGSRTSIRLQVRDEGRRVHSLTFPCRSNGAGESGIFFISAARSDRAALITLSEGGNQKRSNPPESKGFLAVRGPPARRSLGEGGASLRVNEGGNQ